MAQESLEKMRLNGFVPLLDLGFCVAKRWAKSRGQDRSEIFVSSGFWAAIPTDQCWRITNVHFFWQHQ